MIKKILRSLSLLVALSAAMPPLHGMHRFKEGWGRFAATFKGGFGRFGFKANQWSHGFAQNSQFFRAFARANTFNRLSGLTAAAFFAYPISSNNRFGQQRPQYQISRAQPVRIEFTPSNIDAYASSKQPFIEYAKKNITTKNALIVNTIIYLIKKYPDAARELYPLVLQNCTQVNPALQKAVGAQCFVASTIKPIQVKKVDPENVTKKGSEEDDGLFTVGNIVHYGLWPIVDIDIPHAIDKDKNRVNMWDITEQNVDQLVELVDGKMGFKPVEKWPKAIASEIATDVILHYAGKGVEHVTGCSLACPAFKNDNSWNADNRMCRLTQWLIKYGIARPLVRSYIVDPVIGN